jgi:aromatic-L-amino-acid decarboxylase
MTEHILMLEQQARQLEPTRTEREHWQRSVLRHADEFLNSIEVTKAYNTTDDRGAGLLDAPIGEEPLMVEKALNLVDQQLTRNGINAASGGHLGYIPGGGLYAAALGDYLADVHNYYAGVFFASPGAVRMENLLLRWLADLVGYPAEAGGNLASGGSIANLIAIVTARDAHGLTCATIPQACIYATAHVHHCIDKALRLAGLRECPLRTVPMDAQFRMDPDALGRLIVEDVAAGRRPFLVIASAGTTDVGAVDPLAAVAAVAQRHGAWYHVDAAYGGFFILTDYGRERLRGIELADSLVMDPHKGLFLPYGLGMVLVRDRQLLHASQHYTANYMQDAQHGDADELSPAELSPELTKHFRGLRLWLPLKLHGLRPFRACLEEKLWLARYFHQQVAALGFEVGPEPELSVVTYRYLPAAGDADEFNRRLAEAVQSDGRVFISTTVIDGKYTLRFACLSFRTHLATVELLLKILRYNVRELEKASPLHPEVL